MIAKQIFQWVSAQQFSEMKLFILYFLTSIFDIVFNYGYLKIFGNKDDVESFTSDHVGKIWPFIRLSPTIILFILSIKYDSVIAIKFQELGINYNSILLFKFPWVLDLYFGISLVVSLILVIISCKRMSQKSEPIWLRKVKGMTIVRGIVFDLLANFLLILSLGVVFYQWINFMNFFNSSWTPQFPLSSDLSYGLKWIKDILIKEFLLIIIISFTSLLIAQREKKYEHSTKQNIWFILSMGMITIFMIIIIINYNDFLVSVKERLLTNIISDIYHHKSMDIKTNYNNYFDQIILTMNFSQVTSFSEGLKFPQWLQGIIGIRLVIFIFDTINILTNGKWKISDHFLGTLKKLAN